MEGLAAVEESLRALRRVHDGLEDGSPSLYHYHRADDGDMAG